MKKNQQITQDKHKQWEIARKQRREKKAAIKRKKVLAIQPLLAMLEPRRLEKNYSVAQVAYLTETARSVYQKACNGKDLDLSTFYAICDALGLQILITKVDR